jgi:hypothetical protein
MRNFILGCCYGFILGVVGATYTLSGAQSTWSTSPYAPGSFMSDTYLYNGMISQDTDNYLNSRYRDPDPWPQLFSPKAPCP